MISTLDGHGKEFGETHQQPFVNDIAQRIIIDESYSEEKSIDDGYLDSKLRKPTHEREHDIKIRNEGHRSNEPEHRNIILGHARINI